MNVQAKNRLECFSNCSIVVGCFAVGVTLFVGIFSVAWHFKSSHAGDMAVVQLFDAIAAFGVAYGHILLMVGVGCILLGHFGRELVRHGTSRPHRTQSD